MVTQAAGPFEQGRSVPARAAIEEARIDPTLLDTLTGGGIG